MARARRAALLAFCRSLPHVTEDIKWGNDLVFSIGGRMFAGFDKDGRDATFGCKVADEDFPTLTSIEGIRPAPYAARFFWVSVDDPDVLPEEEAIALLRGSYDLVRAKLPARLRADAPGPPQKKAPQKEATRTAGKTPKQAWKKASKKALKKASKKASKRPVPRPR